ncbi:PREDICTED: secreted seminal-vesicle Ly-6 protein 1-like [Galeopterus variegatus]|uniref:Secreted seminal-vesicle Ly-6 protein 1-like n=1 Tax=Galeopterus variegatus TaxID=482537 RepID=A0ABM0SEL0_GALVR|nr:PREDICTED: secreted seminal-vesicle Ly-6 protein 1-like [Galeopterus variegatus]XP_008591301.1 PREDICTED: secreted seminal-vesicle Ly-6 protein 1-like [Galeopterus variegatus]
MGKHLLLLLGLSLLMGFLQALKCHQCSRVSASGVCETEESFCETKDGQQCSLRKVYEGDKISYGYQGCSSVCIPMMLLNSKVAVEYKCCNNSPLCNKF